MKRFLINTTLLSIILVWAGISFAAPVELYIPNVKDADASVVELPIKLSRAQNLAGVKIVLTYDKSALEFIKASKTTHTSPLMHIVNSKNPGRLIIVMAGAMGINGDDITLLTIQFRLKQKKQAPINALVEIKMAELMDAKLKSIEVKLGGAKPLSKP